jgi:propionyl-CoA synthetase
MEDPEKFWGEIGSQMISWDKMYDQVLDDSSSPFTKWFCGGYLNACFNCVDRHIANGQGNKVALIHDSPITNTVRKVTYQELLDTVSRLAGGLKKLGVKKGDRVVIYMPLIPEAIMSMLATVRLGAIHSVVFGGE